MTAGLQIINSGGTYQIDENYRNYQILSTGSGSTSSTYSADGITYKYTDIVVSSGVAPMLGVKSTSFMVVIGVSKSGDTWTFRVACETTQSFTYFVFDLVSTTPGNFGLEVYDAAGDLVFYSGNKPLRIVGIMDINDFELFEGSYTYTSGRDYCIVTVFNGFVSVPYGFNKETGIWDGASFFYTGTNTVDNVCSIELGNIPLGDVAGASSSGGEIGTLGKALVIDVTDF